MISYSVKLMKLNLKKWIYCRCFKRNLSENIQASATDVFWKKYLNVQNSFSKKQPGTAE